MLYSQAEFLYVDKDGVVHSCFGESGNYYFRCEKHDQLKTVNRGSMKRVKEPALVTCLGCLGSVYEQR